MVLPSLSGHIEELFPKINVLSVKGATRQRRMMRATRCCIAGRSAPGTFIALHKVQYRSHKNSNIHYKERTINQRWGDG